MRTDELAGLQGELARLGRPHTPSDVALAMRNLGMVVTDRSMVQALDAVRRHSTGAGPLEALLQQEGVSDVLVNGAEGVFVDRGAGLERSDVILDDEEQVRALAVRLATAAGKRLDDSQPFVDGRLPDGTRLHAILAPVSSPGTCISLRRPADARLTLADLADRGSLNPVGRELLEAIVRRKVPFLISGGTGSGKTTLLAAMLALVAADERVVVVEDAKELVPRHPHCINLEGRRPNGEGAGGITLTHLVRQALRMRPDRVVLGEARGAELADLLTALNTGHEGGCGTLHANSATDVPARLEALAALSGMDRRACHAQVGAALRVCIHVSRRPDGRRHLAEIGVFVRQPDGLVAVRQGVAFDGGTTSWGPAGAELAELAGVARAEELGEPARPRRGVPV